MAFFNKLSYKKFSLATRYYDEEKTELERRRARWKKLAGEEPSDKKDFDAEEFRSELKLRWGMHRESKSVFNRRYTHWHRLVVLLLIMIGLIAAMYFIGLKYAV